MATKILRKVGWALIVVGLLDIGEMIYCFEHDISYFSSFNIFAVVAGVYLLKQNLRAAKLITRFAAFMLAGFTCMIVLFPLVTPIGLTAVEFRLNPYGTILEAAIGCAYLAFVYWVYSQLTLEPVLEARRSAGLGSERPRSAFWAGGVLAIGAFGVAAFIAYGPQGQRAMRVAQKQFGTKFKYHVTAMQWSGGTGSAVLTAYNASEIKVVQVHWGKAVANNHNAIYRYKRAALRGSANAQDALGAAYYYGQGVPKDYAKSLYWYKKAAEQGKADAQNGVGYAYAFGLAVPKNYAKAIYWWKKAAAQGDAGAQDNLALQYNRGEGVPKNYAKAVYWWQKAATQGFARSQVHLGAAYFYGRGEPKNYAKAVYWFRKAAAQGNADAKQDLRYTLNQEKAEKGRTRIP